MVAPESASASETHKMPDLPTIRLDCTLAELYRQARPSMAQKRIAQVLCGINSALELSPNVPRNAKYLYQDSAFNATTEDAPQTPGSEAKLQRDLAMKYLSLIPQRDAFISGDTPVVFFHVGGGDGHDPKRAAHDRAEAEATVAVLAPDQRPRIVFCPGPAEIPVAEHGIDLIAFKIMLDGLESYDLVVPPDTHWLLNSKEALAKSGLPTPRCDVVALDGHGGEAALCCASCKQQNGNVGVAPGFVIPQACEGDRGKWYDEQAARIFRALADRPLPFVLKNQQTFGGAGTYLVRTEKERARIIADLDAGILRKLFSSINPANAHLRPASFLLSDMVPEPIGDYGLTFFVTSGDDPSDGETNDRHGYRVAGERGGHIFLAASEQMIAEGNAWIGSTINYRRQDELKAKFGKLVGKIADWLRSHDYVGPAGADVLETRRPGKQDGVQTNGVHAEDDDDGDLSHFHVVDLNVRTSGSLCLPLLRGHFTGRGLYSASSFSISVRKTRREFIDMFSDEFAAGSLCILSWYEDLEKAGSDSSSSALSLADVAVGAEDEEKLKIMIQRVRDATSEVTF